MNNQVYTFALKSTLQEIQNVCPDITSNFILKDGKVLAKDKNTTEETATQTVETFNMIMENAAIIGGLEAISIQGVHGKVNISAISDFHLATVSSVKADEKYVNTLSRVLIPIVIKLVEEIQPASTENEQITIEDETIETIEPEPVEEVTEEKVDEPEAVDGENGQPDELDEEAEMSKLYEETESFEPEVDNEPMLPEPPVKQLMIENLKGFRVPSDTVRVDQEVIAQWSELYSDKKINEVEIEALNGKTTRCKLKQIKKSKDEGKGVIKMPEKIQIALEAAAGELVTVKPVVE